MNSKIKEQHKLFFFLNIFVLINDQQTYK